MVPSAEHPRAAPAGQERFSRASTRVPVPASRVGLGVTGSAANASGIGIMGTRWRTFCCRSVLELEICATNMGRNPGCSPGANAKPVYATLLVSVRGCADLVVGGTFRRGPGKAGYMCVLE